MYQATQHSESENLHLREGERETDQNCLATVYQTNWQEPFAPFVSAIAHTQEWTTETCVRRKATANCLHEMHHCTNYHQ